MDILARDNFFFFQILLERDNTVLFAMMYKGV